MSTLCTISAWAKREKSKRIPICVRFIFKNP